MGSRALVLLGPAFLSEHILLNHLSKSGFHQALRQKGNRLKVGVRDYSVHSSLERPNVARLAETARISLTPQEKLCPQSLGRNLCSGCRVGEKVRVFLLHLVFTLSGKLMTPPRVPANSDNQNTTLLQTLDLTVHDLDRFFNEVQFDINLDFLQRYSKRFFSHAFL
uniref:Glutamyl-tRNA(Gln) amidotransferase subunit C, chloroplastic/mitochondrial n=1 Tax=Tanacetum cinerariifolium TaxID=118510 RepID=A0A699HQS8_TANCI|nr:glutamyl-tRNA(Gln) amidotransferase subunit C, chloroplastic/mitochondrial [Tanacetum cinerariifolium]